MATAKESRVSTHGQPSVGSETARRHRERESIVLAQIVAHATRLRHHLGTLDASVGSHANANDSPLTLIELIQASTAVFAKHKIQPPSDAVFHRHLLTLSLDPEPDWKKKIQRFAVQQSLHRGSSPHASSVSVGSIARASKRRTSMAVLEVGFQTPSRRRSGVGGGVAALEERPPGRVPPATTRRQSKRSSVDQFGDVLAASSRPSMISLKENQLRNASRAEVATATDGDERVLLTLVTPAQKLHDLATIRTRLKEIHTELSSEGEEEEDDHASLDTRSYGIPVAVHEVGEDQTHSERSINVSGRSIPPHAYYPSPSKSPSLLSEASSLYGSLDGPVENHRTPQFLPHHFRRLATSFQQWRELTTFHRLVRDSRQRELRLTQAVLPPVATFAIFRWVAMALPSRTGSLPSQLSLAVPAFVVTRGLTIASPSLLRHFTGRLLVWTMQRIFTTWAASARAIKTLRIKSLIRRRTDDLETAFQCLYQWRRVVRHRRAASDHGVWVETLHARKCLRWSLSIWRHELKTRRREGSAADLYKRRTMRLFLRSWQRWMRQCCAARAHGSRCRLARSLRVWKASIRWSEEEHRQLVRARTHWTRRVLRSCWTLWRVQRSVLKAKRLRTHKATRHHNGKTAQRVWRVWTESYGTRKVLESKCARFVRRRQTRILRAILTGLYEYVDEKKWHALCVMEACARRHERLTTRVWRAWASHFDASRQDDEERTKQWNCDRRRRVWHLWRRRTRWMRLIGTLTACVSSTRIQYGLFKWKTWAASRRQYRRLVNNWRREQAHLLARRVFRAFQENVKIGRDTLHAAKVLLHRCSSSRLQSYLNAWRQFAQRQRIRRLRDDSLTMVARRLHRRGRWAAWRQVFHVTHSIQIADDAMAQGIQRRCFQQWQKRVHVCRKLLKSAGQLRQHQMKRAIWKLHRRAEANQTHRKNCSVLRDRRDRFLMLRGWTAWRRGFLTATHYHARVAQAVVQWHHKSMAVHFYEWKSVLIRHRERHSRLSAWRQRAAAKTAQSCWRVWQAYLVERHDRRSIVAHADQYSERRSMKRMLQTWRCKCRHSQAQAQVRQTCMAKWRYHEQRRRFQRWERFTYLQRSLRVMDARHRDLLVRRCFAAWCKWKHRRDMAALIDDERTRQLQEWSMRRAVKRLRRHAAACKCMRSSQQLVQLARSRAVQTAMLRRWMRYKTRRMHWHAQIKATEQKIQWYRVQRCVRQWGQFARAKKVLASTIVQATTRTGRGLTSKVFTQWRSFVSDRKLRTTLQERAVAFHVCYMTSRCFQAWKTYVDEQARRQRLLQISSQRRCQLCETRAFQAWQHFAIRARKTRQAIGVRQVHSLFSSFASWRRFLSVCKAKRDAIVHYEFTTGRRVIREWREAAHRQRLHRQFTQVLQAQIMQQCLRHWATHVRKTRRARSFLRRRQCRSLVRVFSSWKALAETQRLTRSEIQQRLGLLLYQHRTMTSFLQWKTLVEQHKLLKTKKLERTRQRTCVLFTRWKTTLGMRKRIAERAVRVRHRHEHALVLAFWSRWKREKVAHEKADVLRQRVLKRASQVLISVLFSAWKAFVCRALVVRAAENKRSHGSLRLRFSRWRDRFVNQRKRERFVAETMRRHHDLALVRNVLVRMRTRMSIKNACTRVLLPQLQRHVLAQAWQKWRQYHAHKRRTSCSVVALRHRLEGKRHSVYDTALVSLRRWQSLQQAHRFCHWRTVALHLQSMRAHTATAIHMWWTRLNRSCFQSWVAWIRQAKRKQTLRASGGHHRRARAWTRWVQYHRNQQRQHLLVEQARRFYRIHATRTATAAWRCVLSRRRHDRLRESAVTLHRVQRSLRKWHGMAVHRRSFRMQCTVATVAAHHKRMSVTWCRWALWVAHVTSQRVELQQQTERLQVLILCSAFRAWRACSQQQRYLTRILSVHRCRWKTATARRVLCTWAGYCRAVTAQRRAVSQLAWTSLMRNAVQRIRLYARQQIAKRGRFHKAQAWSVVVQGRLLGHTFTRWRRFALVSKQKRHAIQRYHLKKLLPGVMHVWKSFVQHSHDTRDRLGRAAGRWRSVSTRRAWQALSAFHRQRRAARGALTTARGHFQARLARLLLVEWRGTIVRKRLLRETSHNVLVRRKLQSTHRCFANWHSFVLGRKASHVAAAMVASRLMASQLQEAWSVWRRQFVVARVCARKQLARVFDRWHRWRWERRAWAEFQATQTQTLLQTVRARCGIQHWKDRVMEAQMRKTMATLSSRFAKDTLVRRCFRNWLAFLVTRHHDKVQMKRVNEWLRNRQLSSCFRGLAMYALAQQHDKRNHAAATLHAKKLAKRQTLSAWRRLTAVANTQRLKLRRHIAATHHATQRKCFVAWRALMSKRIHSRVAYANLVSRRTLLVTRVVLNQWKRSTHKSKRRQTAETFHRHRLCLHSLHQWHWFLVLTRAERMLRAREKRLCERCLVAWRTRAVLCKKVGHLSVQQEERNRRELLENHWTAWRSWSRVQIQCVRLLTHVATQHRARFRFVLWKAFADKNCRLKRLMLGPSTEPRMVEEGTSDSLMLDTPVARLARISRRLQRLQVDWENPSAVWQRWRHAFHACLFYRMRRLYQIFSLWSTWSRRRRFVQVLCSSRLQARRLVLKKTLLLRWRDVVATVKQIQRERRRERELLVIVNAEMVRHERKSLQRHWNAWRERTETKRHLLLSADSYQRARMLTKFWLLWSHDFVNVRRREHQYVASRCAQLSIMKERRAIHRLRIHRAWRVRARSIVSALAHERHRRWYRLCMDQWRRFADTNRRASLLAVFKKRQSVRRVYHGWRIWLASRRLQREEMEKFITRRMARTRGEAFLRWRAYVIHRRQRDDAMALATAFHLQQRLRHRWHRAVQIQKQIRDRTERGRSALATWRQRRAVRRWETTVCTQRLKRRLRMFVQRKHFAQWRQYTQQLLADRFYSHLVHRRMRYSFHRWVDSAQERMHLRECESQLRAVRAGRRRRTLWTAWGAFVRHQRYQRIAREHFSHTLKLKLLLDWYDTAKQTALDRAQLVAEADAFCGFTQKRFVLKQWVLALVRGRQRRAVLLACVVKIQRAVCTRLRQVVLHAWADAADLERFTRECRGILQQRRVARSLHHWRQQIAERRRVEQLQRDAILYRQNRLLSVVFFHWQNYALAWKDAEAARKKDRRLPVQHKGPPLIRSIEPKNEDGANGEDEEMSLHFRRPLSPIKKRYNAMTQARRQDSVGLAPPPSPPAPSLADAASLSLNVKKRLLVLGKWKPTHKSLSHV